MVSASFCRNSLPVAPAGGRPGAAGRGGGLEKLLSAGKLGWGWRIPRRGLGFLSIARGGASPRSPAPPARRARRAAAPPPPETIASVERDGASFDILLPLQVEDWTFLNEKLFGAGVKILEVKEHEIDLEDVFMKITKGAVQ